jgi:putative ABC transport system substrate-binding protein
MRRREFIKGIAGLAVGWRRPAHAQPPALPVIGYLGSETPDRWVSRLQAFRQGLSERGFVEGRDVAIEYRWGEGRNDRLPALAADLVRRPVKVIAAPGSTASALAAKAATATIPVVFYVGVDPVVAGLVRHLNRPGGNLTGVTSLNVEIAPKQLELLHDLVPTATTFALLVNPTNSSLAKANTDNLEATAYKLGLQLEVQQASGESDFEPAFAGSVRSRVGGLIITADTLFTGHSEQLAALAIRYRIPTISTFRAFTAGGGLMSYAGDFLAGHRLAGVYTGRILKGEGPAELPVQRSTKVELIINLNTARALGLDVPTILLARADEVIE